MLQGFKSWFHVIVFLEELVADQIVLQAFAIISFEAEQ